MSSIVVIDYGSQYTRLITRRLRELNVYSLIRSPAVTAAELDRLDAAGVILSGGPSSVTSPGAPGLPPGLLARGGPILAICYGMQLLTREFGGRVDARTAADTAGGTAATDLGTAGAEYGQTTLAHYGGELFAGVEGEFSAWMSHGDSVAEPPPGFVVTATTASGAIAAMEAPERHVYCLQDRKSVV